MRTTLLIALILAGGDAVLAQEMPKTVAEAVAMERADRLPIGDFYSTPANLSATKPGDLLRKEAFTGYTLPKGATAVRIIYHSLDATGGDVATSDQSRLGPPLSYPASCRVAVDDRKILD